MAENNLIADSLRYAEGLELRKLTEAMEKATQLGKDRYQYGNKPLLRNTKVFPWLKDFVLTKQIEENIRNNLSEKPCEYLSLPNISRDPRIANWLKSDLSAIELTDDKVIPFLLNKFISKLIYEITAKSFKKISFEAEDITSFFYFNSDFTIEEVMTLNDKISEKLVELTDIFEMDDLLKFSFVITAEDLSQNEIFITYGMHSG